MSRTFKTADYDATLDVTVRLGDCLPPDHLARFVVDMIAQLDLSAIYARYSRRGGQPYTPEILLALLFYGYATGVFSTRKLERATYDTVPFRFIAGVLGGLQDVYSPAARIGLVWFDAHGDFNTPKTTRSGMLGGMPVAVCAGLAYPRWRERSHIVAPLPTDRILMVDVRNLDPLEEQLIRATDIAIAAAAPGYPGEDLPRAVAGLAQRCDLLYLHIDSDILDESLVPNHATREPNGPSMQQVQAAIDTVMATGKVAALAVVSVYGAGADSAVSVASGIELIRSGLQSWHRYGLPI